MKKRHGGLIVNKTEKVKERECSSWEQFDEDMVDYEEEEKLEDEFLENMASQTMERYQDKMPNKQIDSKPPIQSGSSWYASVHQILQRFRLHDYQIPSMMSTMTEYKHEANQNSSPSHPGEG